MSAIATRELVKRACAALGERGERITPDNVRRELGGGSNTMIVRLLRELSSTPAMVQEQDDATAEPLPEMVQAALDSLGQAIRQVVADMRRKMTSGLPPGLQGTDEAKAQVRELEAALADAQAEIEAIAQEKKALVSRLDTRDGQHSDAPDEA